MMIVVQITVLNFVLFFLQSSQESPATREVQITGFKNFSVSCSTMAKEVDDIYNEPGILCFKKCEKIGFYLGSSSTGKEPRHPPRIIQPNSYYRNFQTIFQCEIHRFNS
jgi:hypothetical protein